MSALNSDFAVSVLNGYFCIRAVIIECVTVEGGAGKCVTVYLSLCQKVCWSPGLHLPSTSVLKTHH